MASTNRNTADDFNDAASSDVSRWVEEAITDLGGRLHVLGKCQEHVDLKTDSTIVLSLLENPDSSVESYNLHTLPLLRPGSVHGHRWQHFANESSCLPWAAKTGNRVRETDANETLLDQFKRTEAWRLYESSYARYDELRCDFWESRASGGKHVDLIIRA